MKMYDEPEFKKLKKQIHFLKGQLDGIEKMLEESKDPNDMFTQTKAVEGGIQRLIYGLLDNL
ncbi:MAG: metal-sensing transcriptional repressor, partial [Candidatus Kryptoniota bacterium]